MSPPVIEDSVPEKWPLPFECGTPTAISRRGATFNGFQRLWRNLKNGEPGQRFQESHLRRQELRRSSLAKYLVMATGTAMFITGIVLLPLPGPGSLFALFWVRVSLPRNPMSRHELWTGWKCNFAV